MDIKAEFNALIQEIKSNVKPQEIAADIKANFCAKSIFEQFKATVVGKYFCFCGRAGRKEFWSFAAMSLAIAIVTGIVSSILCCIVAWLGGAISGLVSLALLLPSLGVTARRLHDIGRSGWWQLLSLIPVIGGIIVLILCIPAGSKESNQYGDPIA